MTALRDLSTLPHFLLQNKGDVLYDIFFDSMTISGTASDICPYLSVIVYGYKRWQGHWQESFVAMTRSRFQPTPNGPTILTQPRFCRECSSLLLGPDIETPIGMFQKEGYDGHYGCWGCTASGLTGGLDVRRCDVSLGTRIPFPL
jgi:hypothetical protein